MKKILLPMILLCAAVTMQAQTTWTYGDHTYTMKGNLTAEKYRSSATGVVTFTNVPSDYEEFEALYKQFLGKTPHGTAAMMPMAMEIYGRDREEGLRCIQLICWPSNVNSVVSQLKEKFGTSQYAPENASPPGVPRSVFGKTWPSNRYKPIPGRESKARLTRLGAR